MAWDPVNGKKVWAIKEKFMTMSGALATGRRRRLLRHGRRLVSRRRTRRPARSCGRRSSDRALSAQPMTYLGPDGRQYVAIYSGVGGAAMVSKAMPGFPPRGSTLYVFSIDGESPSSGAGMLTTDAGAAAHHADVGQTGRR